MTNIPKNNGTVSPQWIWEHCELDTTIYPNNYYNRTYRINDVIVSGTTLISSYAQGTYILKNRLQLLIKWLLLLWFNYYQFKSLWSAYN